MADEKKLYEPFAAVNTPLRDLANIHYDQKLLKECFVETYLRMYDRDAGASYAFNIPAIALRKANEHYRELYIEKCEQFTNTLNISPIIFYGHIGQGKTTYWKHLMFVRAKEDPALIPFSTSRYFIYVEFTDSNPECTDVISDAKSQLTKIVFENILPDHKITESYEELKMIFPAQEIEYSRFTTNKTPTNFRKYILEEKNMKFDGYRREIIRWLLREKKVKICCVLDNIDQHFIFNNLEDILPVLQFLRSQHVQMIIPLRNSNRGFQYNSFFSSYPIIPLCLGQPNYANISMKRIEYLEKFLVQDLKNPIWLDVDHTWMIASDLFKIWKSVCSLIDQNEQVKHSLSMLSNYIVRDYLEIMTNMFCSKPLFFHPLTQERIDYENLLTLKKGKFNGLFIYALMLRNNPEHDENYPEMVIINLFNNRSTSNWNTFLRYHLLHFLDANSEIPMTVAECVRLFQEQYHIESQAIKNCLQTFADKKCISVSTPEGIEVFGDFTNHHFEQCTINISYRGSFHLELAKEIQYYDVLAIPRLKRQKRDYRQIEETSRSERANNLRAFILHLKQEETLVKAISTNEKNYEKYLFWTKEILPSLEDDYKGAFGQQL